MQKEVWTSCRAELINRNVKICLNFQSFLNSEMVQLVKILLCGRRYGPFYSASIVTSMVADGLAMQWARASATMDLVILEYSSFSTRRVFMKLSTPNERLHRHSTPLLAQIQNAPRSAPTLQWRHNERDGVSNHQPHDCLLNRLFRRRSKKTSKLRVTGLCEGNSPVTGEFPSHRASNEENVPIRWRYHEEVIRYCLKYRQPFNTCVQFNRSSDNDSTGFWPPISLHTLDTDGHI